MQPSKDAPEIPIGFGAIVVLVLAFAVAGWRAKRRAVDLATAGQQLRQVTKHNGEQAERIAELEAERPGEMFESMRREMGEVLLELDGPAGDDVDGEQAGDRGVVNPGLQAMPPEPDFQTNTKEEE